MTTEGVGRGREEELRYPSESKGCVLAQLRIACVQSFDEQPQHVLHADVTQVDVLQRKKNVNKPC